jgi:hypothetical protein
MAQLELKHMKIRHHYKNKIRTYYGYTIDTSSISPNNKFLLIYYIMQDSSDYIIDIYFIKESKCNSTTNLESSMEFQEYNTLCDYDLILIYNNLGRTFSKDVGFNSYMWSKSSNWLIISLSDLNSYLKYNVSKWLEEIGNGDNINLGNIEKSIENNIDLLLVDNLDWVSHICFCPAVIQPNKDESVRVDDKILFFVYATSQLCTYKLAVDKTSYYPINKDTILYNSEVNYYGLNAIYQSSEIFHNSLEDDVELNADSIVINKYNLICLQCDGTVLVIYTTIKNIMNPATELDLESVVHVPVLKIPSVEKNIPISINICPNDSNKLVVGSVRSL